MTPIQELIEWCNSCLTDLTLSEGAKTALDVTIVRATDLLEKEKEQICNAYTDGLEGPYLGAEEYYYDLYNQSIKKITITENNNQPNL